MHTENLTGPRKTLEKAMLVCGHYFHPPVRTKFFADGSVYFEYKSFNLHGVVRGDVVDIGLTCFDDTRRELLEHALMDIKHEAEKGTTDDVDSFGKP